MSKKYFVCGAYWGGHGDLTDLFINRGYWQMGWSIGEKPQFDKRIEQIEVGDRIAIKTCGNKNNLIIKAIGVVEALNPKNKNQVFVDWKLTNLNREVKFKGCMGTIHGAYKLDKDNSEWIKNIFTL